MGGEGAISLPTQSSEIGGSRRADATGGHAPTSANQASSLSHPSPTDPLTDEPCHCAYRPIRLTTLSTRISTDKYYRQRNPPTAITSVLNV